ncbi:hypothetical protein COBT_001392 [Conglomerata obtusa]
MSKILAIDLSDFDKNKKYVCNNFKPPSNTTYKLLIDSDIHKTVTDFHIDKLDLFQAKINFCKNLECKWKEVYEIEFDIALKFQQGDSIGVLCPNNSHLVDRMFELLNINPDTIIEIFRSGYDSFKYCGTLKNFFTNHFDFKCIPKKSFLYALANFSDKKDLLLYLCSKEGSDDYFKLYINWNNLIDILEFFEAKPTLDLIINFCSVIKPRYFSLTNKQEANAKILIGILHNKDKTRYGHCSEFFRNIAGEQLINVCYRENKLMRLRESKKILMIATGTGLAPFMSFVESGFCEQWLIYGCRDEEDDLSKAINIRKNVLFSCENNRVTSFLRENMNEIEKYVKEECLVYVCGNMNMQNDILKIVEEKLYFLLDEQRIFFDNWL